MAGHSRRCRPACVLLRPPPAAAPVPNCRCPLLARARLYRCSRPPAALLSALGRSLQFELAVGLNGRVWLDAPRWVAACLAGCLPAVRRRGACLPIAVYRWSTCLSLLPALPGCLAVAGCSLALAPHALALLPALPACPAAACSSSTVILVANAIQSSEFLTAAQQEQLVAALLKGSSAAAAQRRQQQQQEQQQVEQQQ